MTNYLDLSTSNIDFDGLRRGYYADPPYLNIAAILSNIAISSNPHISVSRNGVNYEKFNPAEALVETHWIARRAPYTLLAGMPIVLSMLRECTGYYDKSEKFINTASSLEIEALNDGEKIEFSGNPLEAKPVLIVKGRFRDFALLKTPILGSLSRASRIATNTYHALDAAKGKPVYFFSARFDAPDVQAIDGYAYHVAVQRYNQDNNSALSDAVSTYANAEWWGGEIEGTISHEGIACFMGDVSQLMLKFAEILPVNRIRVALVDFNNDCVSDTRQVMRAMFERYKKCVEDKNPEEAMKYKLNGIRIDTSRELIDASLQDNPEIHDYGPSPRLVTLLREVINNEWMNWQLPTKWHQEAEKWCRDVKIMVSGGFTDEKIKMFESSKAPVDFYGVGSWMLSNCAFHGTVTDFSSVIMKLKVGDEWLDIPKIGRQANFNKNLIRRRL